MAQLQNQNARLDRIEEKIDKLADAMVAIARTEERLIAMESKNISQYDRLNNFSKKLDQVEKTVNANASTVQTINKLFWVGIISLAGAVAAQIWM